MHNNSLKPLDPSTFPKSKNFESTLNSHQQSQQGGLSKQEYYGGARTYSASPFNIPGEKSSNPKNISSASGRSSKEERHSHKKSKRRNRSSSSSSSDRKRDYNPGVKKPPIMREGDWECPDCKNINFSRRTECNRCKVSKPLPSKKDRKSQSHFGGPPGLFKEGDWACPKCRNINFQRRNKCNRCGEEKPDDSIIRTGKGGGHYDRQDPKDKKSYREDEEEYDDFGRRKKKNHNRNDSDRSKSNSKSKQENSRSKSRSRSRSRSRS